MLGNSKGGALEASESGICLVGAHFLQGNDTAQTNGGGGTSGKSSLFPGGGQVWLLPDPDNDLVGNFLGKSNQKFDILRERQSIAQQGVRAIDARNSQL